MKTLKKHLSSKFKSKDFKEIFDEEKQLLDLSIKIQETRQKKGLSQAELADLANITQQQLSKIENGINCNIITFLKVCKALELKINIQKQKALTA